MNEGNVKYLYITSIISSLKLITKTTLDFLLLVISYDYKIY